MSFNPDARNRDVDQGAAASTDYLVETKDGVTSLTPRRQTRRRVMQGAAAAAVAAGAVYLKPSFHSFGVPVALAASGTCGGLIPYGQPGCTGPLDTTSNCCQDSPNNIPTICKDFGAGNICCDAISVCL